MIKITKSPTADTRTCDWSKVTIDTLKDASKTHIDDVYQAMSLFADTLIKAGVMHDHTKLSAIDQFHKDFSCGFKTQDWYDMHKREERHHLGFPEGVRDDVNLIDVLEYIADCVMAGMARSGSVYDLTISNEVLRKAFNNTTTLLKNNVEVTT